MNRTIKNATVKRYHYDSHEQLRAHLADFVSTYNFGRRLKTLRGLKPYEAICKSRSAEPSRFRSDRLHQMPNQTSRSGAMTGLGCSVGTLLFGIMAGAVSGWVFGLAMLAAAGTLGVGRRARLLA